MKDEWKWQRVTKKDSCPICGHPDWCTVCVAHGLALCMREPSQRPSKNAMGGWLHARKTIRVGGKAVDETGYVWRLDRVN